MVVGLVAHVDAGKTTLSEALLYRTGAIKAPGRVDHQDSYLDNDVQERERGITIFSKQARIAMGNWQVTLLDTPGHVDFSAEMERTLQVLDYAVLVISGTDGVQAHTRTLWKLLRHYEVPVFLFVNKMDLPGANRGRLLAELKAELSDNCVDFSTIAIREELQQLQDDGYLLQDAPAMDSRSQDKSEFYEELALCGEDLLNEYMESGEIAIARIQEAIRRREVFPCFFGSALRIQGVDELLAGLRTYTSGQIYPQQFAARVYKIGRDARGVRLTYLKLTGGSLAVKEAIDYADVQEKVEQIRIYNGEKYEAVPQVRAGEVCAVTGLTKTYPGMGLGAETHDRTAILEPVLNYQIFLPQEISPIEMSGKLKQLEEEDPQLHVLWDEELQELHIQMMGQVQIEVLTRLIKERFGVTVVFGPGNIVYKETIAKPVEGIGHFEPLRHYAEVHLLLEPGERGSGIQVASACSTDYLDANWQHLIATHIMERDHRGVLTGSVLTDVKITILSGRAHPKHTEGGDFRKATYRAIRQGLKCTESVLLEPYYHFVLEVPMADVGRTMTEMEQRFAKFGAPENGANGMVRLQGRGPVATLQPYISQVHAYTHGLGSLTVELDGYDVCHNSEEVIAAKGYDSEADLKNPTGSVFCAHGSGFVVPWDEVEHYMHLPHAWTPEEGQVEQPQDGLYYDTDGQAFGPDTSRPGRASWEKSVASMSETELDAELADVYAREFGMSGDDLADESRRKWAKKSTPRPKTNTIKYDQKGNPIYPKKRSQEEYLIVDGYNIIFAWDELKELARVNIDAARDRLMDILHNYQAYRKCHLLLVFDAYRVKGNPGRVMVYDGKPHGARKDSWERSHTSTSAGETLRQEDGHVTGVHPSRQMPGVDTTDGVIVAYTREDETADAFIERTVHQIGSKYRITVATSDGLEQMTVLSLGALRMSAQNLKEEIERSNLELYSVYLHE